MTGKRYVVRGVVQGVGFRWFVLRNAHSLGLRGWVTNRPDGTVEVVAEGAAAALDELERALTQGPRGARVEQVEQSENPHHLDGITNFGIR
ncbi:MAG TPA: acylphosphatase [Gemmatimonadales bacterium]|nr:acylphosphatase [Gemmatimonadales bacterium]